MDVPPLAGRHTRLLVEYKKEAFFVGILDILFPKRCVGCGRIGKYFCEKCTSSIRIILPSETICPVCEKPAIDGATHPGCRTRYTVDGLTSFFRYDGVVRKAVKSIKYRRVFDLAKEFINLVPSPLFSQLPIRNFQFAILIPVPLHWLRQRDRGFNQAEALGALLTQKLQISLRTDMLRRVKMTAPQVEMKKREDRLKNMEGVFAVGTGTLTHGHIDAIFLFDDVFTTGATMRAAANILKRAGVKFVWGITMAR